MGILVIGFGILLAIIVILTMISGGRGGED